MIKISIVVPIYNVEKYLDRCIKSILNQEYKNFEVILVDDGSPDNCPKMCEDWAKKDARIKVIHKENGGLGYARNSGLEAATGDYVLFIDSDDYIEHNLLSDIVTAVDEYGEVDLLQFGHKKIDENFNVLFKQIPDMPKSIYKDEEVQEILLPELLGTNPYREKGYSVNCMSAWCYVYKLSVLRNNKFHFVSERDIISEDIYSNLQLMRDIHSVVLLNKAYYNYCQNGTSLTLKYREGKYERVVDLYKKAILLCNDMNYNKEVTFRLNALLLTMTINCVKNEVRFVTTNGFGKTYKNIKKILNDEILRKALEVYPSKQYTTKRRALQFCMKRKWILLLMLLVCLKGNK